jgi:RNA polymerase sigma-70 factor (ECF subfamily)
MRTFRSEIETSSSLIRHAQQMDSSAWDQLSKVYAPVVYNWSRVAGLQPDDAAEIVQDVFHSVFLNLGRFEANSFRGWLWIVTRNAIYYQHRQDKQRPKAAGGTDFHDLMQNIPREEPHSVSEEPNPGRTSQQIVQKALDLIRDDFSERTWNAFWFTAIEQKSYSEVAKELSMREGAVRQARYRVTQRLKETLEMID